MDTAMRDLELIQERSEEESPGRKAAMLGMAGISTVALVFAMGVMLGGESNEETTPADDPLAALAPAMVEHEPDPSDADDEEDAAAIAEGEVRFHAQLTDDRPEVEAALAAAAAEQSVLDAQPATPTSALPVAAVEAPAPAAVVEPRVAPAGDVARAPTENAIPDDVRPAARGSEGAFTLQVVSYRTRAEADLFAEALRGRGHSSYVTRAELPERGTYFRVRIGPFDTRVAAERYRATFDREENMNTYVVDTERAAAHELATASGD